MATKLILNRDIDNLGAAGEVVEVKDGFARNYLLPRGYAVRWTRGAQRHIDKTVEQLRKAEIASVEEATALRERIEEAEAIQIAATTGAAGRLFGAVTARQLAAALAEKFAVPFDPRNIDFAGPIKSTGNYEMTIKLFGDISAKTSVEVVSDQD